MKTLHSSASLLFKAIGIATLSQLSRWDRIIICQFGARLEIQAHYFPAANL